MIITSFLGLRNTSPARSIPDNALVAADDVDIDDAGIIAQRNGSTLSKALSLTSAYSTLDQTGYVVSGGNLFQVLDDLTTVDLGACSAKEFTDSGKTLFTDDGLKVEDGAVTNLRLPLPALPLGLSLAPGDLPAGAYSATYTYRGPTGLESGSAPVASIELAAPGGVVLAPVTPPPGYTVKYYLTEANGSVYYDNAGVQLDPAQLLADSFPTGAERIAYHDSRLFVSQTLGNGASVIWYSKPFQPHLWDFGTGYLIIPGRGLAMASSAQGLIIGTDAAIYAYDGALRLLAGYGVVPGRPMARAVDGRVFIHSRRGQCVAPPFENITERKVSLPPGAQCSAAIVEQDGVQKFVVLTDGGGAAFNKRS